MRVSAPVRGHGLVTATLDANAVAMMVRSLLYAPETRGWVPAVVHAAAEGNDAAVTPYVVRGTVLAAAASSVGLYLSVTCAEDVAGVTALDADRATAGTFLGTARVGPILRACTFWPRGRIPADFHEPLRTDAPVLLLGGTMDPATPAAMVEHLRASVPNARAIVVPGGGHGVSEVGCVPAVVARFVDTPAARWAVVRRRSGDQVRAGAGSGRRGIASVTRWSCPAGRCPAQPARTDRRCRAGLSAILLRENSSDSIATGVQVEQAVAAVRVACGGAGAVQAVFEAVEARSAGGALALQ